MYLVVGQLEVHSNMHTCGNVKYCIFMKRKEREKEKKMIWGNNFNNNSNKGFHLLKHLLSFLIVVAIGCVGNEM